MYNTCRPNRLEVGEKISWSKKMASKWHFLLTTFSYHPISGSCHNQTWHRAIVFKVTNCCPMIFSFKMSSSNVTLIKNGLKVKKCENKKNITVGEIWFPRPWWGGLRLKIRCQIFFNVPGLKWVSSGGLPHISKGKDDLDSSARYWTWTGG